MIIGFVISTGRPVRGAMGYFDFAGYFRVAGGALFALLPREMIVWRFWPERRPPLLRVAAEIMAAGKAGGQAAHLAFPALHIHRYGCAYAEREKSTSGSRCQ